MSFLGSVLGSVAGGLLDVAGNAASSWLGNKFSADAAEDMAEYNFKLSKELGQWQALNMPKYTVQGLRAAGINPLLAYGSLNSSTVPLVHNTAPQQSFSLGKALSELPERASALATARAQRDLLKAQTHEVNERAKSIGAQTHWMSELNNAQVSLRKSQADYFMSQIPKQAGTTRFKVGLPYGLFSWESDLPLGGGIFRPTKSPSTASSAASAFRESGVSAGSGATVDNGLDSTWMPFPIVPKAPVKSQPKKSKPSKSRSDASWVPGGSARDNMHKRMMKF